MFGVDMRKPGAQEYYNSLFKMYASWGVDYVKVDDISRPYDDVQRLEIEALRKAIDSCGRPMVLSLSPGKTPIEAGPHVTQFANMWRISDDFWDRWEPLYDMIELVDQWTPYRKDGAWPDADMLPFGIVQRSNPTRFTEGEQRLCMSLWCIARSPLLLGADMTQMDEFTVNLLTNPDVLAVNQASTANRQLSRKNDLVVWTAEVPNSPDRYVAFINAQSQSGAHDLFPQAQYKSEVVSRKTHPDGVELSVSIKGGKKLFLGVGPGGDGPGWDDVAWIDPVLTGPKGTLPLTDLKWEKAVSGRGKVRVNRTYNDRPLEIDGTPLTGIGAHAVSLIEYDLPEGYDTFKATGRIVAKPQDRATVDFIVMVDPKENSIPDENQLSVAFAEIGLPGKVKVRDLWNRKDLGTFEKTFGADVPIHDARLYRLSPID
jgi:hypothetical protein